MKRKIFIDGIETNYTVTEEGIIENKDGHIMAINKGAVQLMVSGKHIGRTVGRIVAETFLENPENKPKVGHKDGDKMNNRIENLMWVTDSENTKAIWEKRRINNTTNAGKPLVRKNRKNIVDLTSVEFQLNENEKQVILDGKVTYYAISTDGKLRNLITNRYLKGSILNTYRMYNLTVEGKKKNIMEHRLVALMFLPNPENKPFIDHINGIRTDNRLENLRWCTNKENCQNLHLDSIYTTKGIVSYSLSEEDLQGEVWKQKDDIDLYVSNFGRAKSKGKIIKGTVRTDGYHEIKVSSLQKGILTHRLVWEAFYGKIPEKMVINHKNGIKNDNRLDNLEMVTHQQNMAKASEETNAWNFRKVGEFDRQGNKLREFANASVAAREIGILPGSMRNTIRRKGTCYNGLVYRYL